MEQQFRRAQPFVPRMLMQAPLNDATPPFLLTPMQRHAHAAKANAAEQRAYATVWLFAELTLRSR
jgi:hypothetical protein